MRSFIYPDGFYLKTLGPPAILQDGEPVQHVQSKDLALLIFLRLECHRSHQRKDVAELLFRDDSDPLQRLYNANGRLRKLLGKRVIRGATFGRIQGSCDLPCDAAELLSGLSPDSLNPLVLDRYVGNFLEGFTLTDGADGFEYWKGEIWTRLRDAIERVWLRVLKQAAERQDWKTVCDRGLQILTVAPEADVVRGLVFRSWIELGEYDRAEANYSLLKEELAAVGDEPPPEITGLLELVRQGSHRPLNMVQVQEVGTWRVPVHEEGRGALTPVDVFLSAAMAATESAEQYELERAQVMLLLQAVRDLGYPEVYFAGESRPTYQAFEDEADALHEVVETIRRTRVFVLFYPKKRASSSLIELGMAMALGKQCLVLVNDRRDLPFLLVSPSRHHPPVEVFKYRDVADVLDFLRRHLGRLMHRAMGLHTWGP
ncbi:MAG TPA: hypothetical protein VF615_08795 [Longimicrobiaceae bacterium]|jgi:DNA-binding SARP family transcriptional activator